MFKINVSEEEQCKGVITNVIYYGAPNIYGQRSVKYEYEYFVDGIRYVSTDHIFDINNSYGVGKKIQVSYVKDNPSTSCIKITDKESIIIGKIVLALVAIGFITPLIAGLFIIFS